MRIFYCYSIPLKEYLETNGISPINKNYKINLVRKGGICYENRKFRSLWYYL